MHDHYHRCILFVHAFRIGKRKVQAAIISQNKEFARGMQKWRGKEYGTRNVRLLTDMDYTDGVLALFLHHEREVES